MAAAARLQNLRRILEDRRQVLVTDLRQIIRESREGAFVERADAELGGGDSGEMNVQDDVRFAMISMKAEMLARVDNALARLAEGRYGRCEDCGQDIAERRLRAVPFAFRCTRCEGLREEVDRRRAHHDREVVPALGRRD